jgi:hypothetical protein
MTREPLLWDDPNRDIGADMVATVGRRIMGSYRHLDATAAANIAAAHIGKTFTLAQTSIAEAIRQITESTSTSVAALTKFTDEVEAAKHQAWTQPDEPEAPSYPIDLRRRRPVYGRVTHIDLDLQHDRIADEYERLLKKHRADEAFWHIRNSLDVLSWLERRRDPLYRPWLGAFPSSHDVWLRPRGMAKTSEAAEAMLAWAREFQRVTGEKPAVVRYYNRRGHSHAVIYDESHLWRDADRARWAMRLGDPFDDELWQAEQADRRGDLDAIKATVEERLRPYREVVADDVRRLSAESGVPMAVLGSQWEDAGHCSADEG